MDACAPVDTGMRVEPSVLGRDERIDEQLRQFVQRAPIVDVPRIVERRLQTCAVPVEPDGADRILGHRLEHVSGGCERQPRRDRGDRDRRRDGGGRAGERGHSATSSVAGSPIPCTSGSYISSALTGNAAKRPAAIACAVYVRRYRPLGT